MGKKKVVLITGASKRIGKDISKYFHKKGFDVILHFNKSFKEAENLKKELLSIRESSCITFQADFSDKTSINSAIKELLATTDRIDVLINNASSFYATPIETAEEDEWLNLLDTNATIPFFLIKALKPLLEKSEGCVINISDSEVERGISQFSLYVAAKAALESLTKSLAKELAPRIRVNALAPGIILWPDKDEIDEESKMELINKTSLKRIGEPKDISSAAYMLYESTYITGQVIKVDGGRSI
tara:strand:+ start:11150 stop:11881 length:732 start_codon:yes stop_codon:yes gene_type:complete